MATAFDYSNLSGRPPGRFVSLAARVVPGVRTVQDQVEPYAQAWQQANADALAGAGPLWVALGDSMTIGIGASAPDRGWVGQVLARHPGWRVVNLAVSGGRVRDVLDRQLPALEALGVVPALVTVLIGSNDIFSPELRPQLAPDMATLLDRLPRGTVVGNQPGTHPPALEVNALIDEAVATRGLVLANFRTPEMRSWRGRLAADHFHPNDVGYAGMADIFDTAVEWR